MSSFLCFVCHSTVNSDTNEETRDKYREVIGMNLCPDSHLCYICCYFLNKMCMFKSICLKRSLEYPVLFSEKGTINLQRSLTSVSILCPEDICLQHLNTRYHFYNNNDNSQSDFDDSNYCELQDDRNFDLSDTLLKSGPLENFHNEDYLFVTKDNVVDNLFNEELMIPNLGPVRITQNDLVNGKWMENVPKSDKIKNSTLLELNSRSDVNFDRIIGPVIIENNLERQMSITDNNIQNLKQVSITDKNIHENLKQVPITDKNIQEHVSTMTNKNDAMVLTLDEKSEQVIRYNVAQNFQDITVHNLNFNSKSCYEHVENVVNENTENNIFEDRKSSNVNVDHKLNDSVNYVNSKNQSTTGINEMIINSNHLVCKTNELETTINRPLINIKETVTVSNDYVNDINESNVNESVNNINQNVIKINNSETIVIESLNNTNKCVTYINKPKTNTTELETNTNEPEININEPETNLNENLTNNTKIYEEENSSDAYNNSDIPDSNNEERLEEKSKTKKKKKKKDLFEKIFLSLEEQKAELDRGRKDEKYTSAAFKCHSCAMYFHFKDTYQTHMMRHEESNGEHCCSICSLRFANPAVLRSHASNHRARYRCRVCGAKVRARQRQTHARACTGKRDTVNCHLCGKMFPCGQYFQQHLQRYHGTDSNKQYLCNVCGKSFNTRSRVRTHMITHINRKFECDQCPSTFSSPYTLTQHKRSKHVMSEPQVHHCASCDTTYTTRKSLLAHRRNSLAHKESVYKCNICGRCCPTAVALSRHTACVHTRSKHIACSLCHKRYSTSRALVRHMTSNHKEGKPVPLCHSCGMTFKSTTILKKHLRNVCEKNKKCHNIIEDELLQVTYFE